VEDAGAHRRARPLVRGARGGTRLNRHLEWQGCFNVRDLGGLRTGDGRATRFGRIVRADALDGLTEAGWAALGAYGVRTVIDLRNDDERGDDAAPRPASIRTRHVPLDASDDREFWDVWDSGPQFGTPLYYAPHLERFPERSAAVLSAIARAAPGGVVFHCGGGRDRAGQITMLVLALAGVEPEAIAADYELSAERLPARYAARGEHDQGPLLAGYLAERGTTAGALIVSTLAGLDVEARLALTSADAERLRRRLLDP
jgi:protein-tyrosine phosphatase